MSDALAQGFFVAGTVPLILAGSLHAVGALLDTRRPTFFTPTDDRAIPVMEATGVRLREMFPGSSSGRLSVWRAWLGFNVSHGVGVAAVGLLLLLIALHDFEIVEQVGAIGPFSVAVALVYFLLSLRYWFYGPAIVTGVSTACFAVATLA